MSENPSIPETPTTKKNIYIIPEIDVPILSLKKDEDAYKLIVKTDMSSVEAMNLAGLVYDLCSQCPDLVLKLEAVPSKTKIIIPNINV